MPHQFERLVFGHHEDVAKARVDAIRKRKVDDPVDSAEPNGRFRDVLGEGVQSLAGASGEQNRKDVIGPA